MDTSITSFSDVIYVAMRHKWKMATFFVGTLVLFAIVIMLTPREYASEAKVYIRIGRENVSLDPTATTGQVIETHEPREQQINTIRDLLRSRVVLEQVVDKIGPDAILKPESKVSTSQRASTEASSSSVMDQLVSLLVSVNLIDPISDRERAIGKLSKKIAVSKEDKSNIIQVTTRAATPELAQQIAKEFLMAYRDQHMRAHRTDGSLDFFSDQTQLLREELEKNEKRLRDEKNEMGIVTIESKQVTLSDRIGLIEADQLRTAAALAASDAKISHLRASLAKTSDRLITHETTEASDAADEMRRVLYELQIRQRELLAQYTESHPLVLAIQDQVQGSKKLLDAEGKRRTHPTKALNPAYQQQQLSLLAEEAIAAGHKARASALANQRAKLHAEIEQLNSKHLTIGKLQRDIELLRDNYLTYSRDREQARVDRELESSHISNVNVVQRPTLVTKPVRPKKAMIALLGICVATSGAFGLAFYCEYADRPLTSTKDIEEALNMPALQTVTISNGGRNGNRGVTTDVSPLPTS